MVANCRETGTLTLTIFGLVLSLFFIYRREQELYLLQILEHTCIFGGDHVGRSRAEGTESKLLKKARQLECLFRHD